MKKISQVLEKRDRVEEDLRRVPVYLTDRKGTNSINALDEGKVSNRIRGIGNTAKRLHTNSMLHMDNNLRISVINGLELNQMSSSHIDNLDEKVEGIHEGDDV